MNPTTAAEAGTAALSAYAWDNPVTQLVRVFSQPNVASDGALVLPVLEAEYAALLAARSCPLVHAGAFTRPPYPALVEPTWYVGPAYLMECEAVTYFPTARFLSCQLTTGRSLFPGRVKVQVSQIEECEREKRPPYVRNVDWNHYTNLKAQLPTPL